MYCEVHNLQQLQVKIRVLLMLLGRCQAAMQQPFWDPCGVIRAPIWQRVGCDQGILV